MSLAEDVELLTRSLAGLIQDRRVDDPRSDAWDALHRHGLVHPFAAGADDWRLGAALLREAGRHALGVPLAENIVASFVLAQCGAAPPGDILSLASPLRSALQLVNGHVGGSLRAVPHAGVSSHVLAVAETADGAEQLVCVELQGAVAQGGTSAAGEPRDDLQLEAAPAQVLATQPGAVAALGPLLQLMRAAQLLGLAEWVLESSLAHVRTREQFGRPLSAFQAVRHLLAELAGEVAAAQMAVSLADLALSRHGLFAVHAWEPAVATACCQSACLCERAIRVGHQLHGAMGYTREHGLGARSLRLMVYRSELGGAADSARWLGERAMGLGSHALWADVIGEPEDRP